MGILRRRGGGGGGGGAARKVEQDLCLFTGIKFHGAIGVYIGEGFDRQRK